MRPDIKKIGQNVFPGFVVSLVALPLSLGLALASGVPPIAGVITAIVGGVLVSLLGGSHVTITGPGNGLVVANLTAVMALGAGDAYAGYLYTLAAVVVSGFIILAMGFLRLGNLSDFFPSAAIRGMLAAIGLIIMAKQLHLILGEMDPQSDATAALYIELPNTIGSMLQGQLPALAYIVGLGSLLLMFLYPYVRNKVLRLIPAPMWVVIIGISLTYFSSAFPHILQPLPQEFLVNVPDNFVSELTLPDFGKIGENEFWMAVVTLTLISVVESLLSIKGVDKLDPQRRRSNANKDLRALGLATMVSGAVGGLNVVTVIARSSVNVHNGGTTRASNFFQGLFILLFVLLFAPQIQHTPLPALAAILVYAGYKLTSPAIFARVAKVGWEQLVIFLATLITTIFVGIIIGIVVGMAATLLFQLRVLRRIKLFVRYTFRPNTLLYKEDENQYHLSVRAYSNFLNFPSFRKNLDSIPLDSEVIVDFSLSEFVDHSVLEQLEDYYQSFRDSGGDLEIIGLDDLRSKSSHPLAPRLPSAQTNSSRASLSPRQKGLRLFAQRLGWDFTPDEFYYFNEFQEFKYFSTRKIDKGRNRGTGAVGDIEVVLADIDYHEGEFIARKPRHSTMAILKLPMDIPIFVMDKEKLLDKVAHLAGFSDISFTRHPDFSHTFKVKGSDRKSIHRFFDDELIDFFQANKAFHVESNGKSLLIFEKERQGILREIKQMVSFANRLALILNKKLKA